VFSLINSDIESFRDRKPSGCKNNIPSGAGSWFNQG
jgi:hypothetical protein